MRCAEIDFSLLYEVRVLSCNVVSCSIHADAVPRGSVGRTRRRGGVRIAALRDDESHGRGIGGCRSWVAPPELVPDDGRGDCDGDDDDSGVGGASLTRQSSFCAPRRRGADSGF